VPGRYWLAAVRIERYDPKADEDRLRACHQLIVSAQAEDDPNVPPFSIAMFRGWLVHGFPDEPPKCFFASTDSGAPLGCYALDLPQQENRQNGFINLLVGAGSRRRGIGTALLAHAARQAEVAGRALLMSNARVGAPGAAFAAAVGATAVLQDARRILDVGPDLHGRLPGLRAEAEPRATGYSLRRWIGQTPDDLVVSACALNAAMADAPHSDSYEPINWDADRLRAAEQRSVIQGTRDYSVAAIQDGTGEMVALTQVTVDPAGAPGWAYQQLTAVTRAHRGHRLSLLLKVAMLEWLATAEPQLRQIMTFNAVPNEYMIAVNEALGHRVSDYFQTYELPVDAALKLPVTV
jgi:GNAT superfamily N-acetyltransferase/RimJ/RimL family protein N-acetyltransferase